jgi:TBC1 domain family protein 5
MYLANMRSSRWLRLLFGREFPLKDTYRLWDAIFADDKQLGSVEFVCIAMLLLIREECK